MKKNIIFTFIILAGTVFTSHAQLYKGTGAISFYSSTPVEDINANSLSMNGLMNPATKELVFIVSNRSFEFKNKLMQEHFNEKYMESEKYPNSVFKGKINENIDVTKDGAYNVTATGKLNVHGVEKDRTINGVLTVNEGKVQIRSDFKVLVKDHNIDIPKLVIAKVAEEISVKMDLTMLPKK